MDMYKLLLVDDEPDNLALLYRTLRGKYDITKTTSPIEALDILEKQHIDLVISDHKMPEMDGVEFLKRVYDKHPDTMRLLLTAYTDASILIDAINYAKIYRYIKKPYEPSELLLTVANTLEYLQLKLDNIALINDLKELFAGTIKAIIDAMDAKDSYTTGKSKRVTFYTMKMVKALNLDTDKANQIELAAMLHDIGMIGVSDDIIYKVDKLSDDDWTEIKNHIRHGVRILEDIKQLRDVVEIIKYHHEYYNGNGYPAGLHGEEIPLGSRIIAIADAYDAMVSKRAYRPARTEEQALEILHNMRGIQFDPALVEVFDGIFEEAKSEISEYEKEAASETENQETAQ
ncbi:MAG: response regulator [Candidatus Gastranaerophilales bacterium]|nr:response regulator [Candidatus Gastranaerophilales bacterium]